MTRAICPVCGQQTLIPHCRSGCSWNKCQNSGCEAVISTLTGTGYRNRRIDEPKFDARGSVITHMPIDLRGAAS